MRLTFRIDCGYQMLYSRRHYHPTYVWDGRLECAPEGEVKLTRLEYPVVWWGPCLSAVEHPLPGKEWQFSTRRGLAGIKVDADCETGAVFKLFTASGAFNFSAQEIMEKGQIIFPVGPKYGFCAVRICLDGYRWFQPQPRPGQFVTEAPDLDLPLFLTQRSRLAVLAPQEEVEIPVELPEVRVNDAVTEYVVHLQAMALLPDRPDGENHCAGEIPLTLTSDRKVIAEQKHYFRFHDECAQMLEDVWLRFPAASAPGKIAMKNGHAQLALGIHRIQFESRITRHLQMILPPWALKDELVPAKIFACRAETATISVHDIMIEKRLSPGWNEFSFTASKSARSLLLHANTATAHSEAKITVYGMRDEVPEVMVGFDMTTVTHDGFGQMDWLLDYTWRTRLGNTVVFRNFRPSWKGCPDPDDRLLKRWGSFCQSHHIYVQSVNCHHTKALAEAAGEYMHNAGRHEYPGVVYAFDPEEGHESSDMKQAYERYIAFLKEDIDQVKAAGLRPAYGDASGGHRHCYLAGASFIRSETMVPHTQHLCSLARPAAEALGQGDWGVHIAIQHAVQPYHPEHHLGQYFLSLYQPWMMGASMIYEEDSLFQLFKEERQSWDDALTRGKRELTRDFFRFAKTHPRLSRPHRHIAFYEGRYAAPFNGFICGPEQDPDYSVWGKFGNSAPEWAHRQPEKCRHLLDVLMPGASVHPLRQRYDKRRFYFSGTPYGDFDQVPAEAPGAYLQQYKLLLNFGWNTMIQDDYVKLKKFVRDGGTLFTGLPQFSTHVKRDFLREMKDLALFNQGDLTELCGVHITGRSVVSFAGNWNAAGREKFIIPELSRSPNDSPGEDGLCHLAEVQLAGAEIIAWDADSGKPLIVRHKFGRGTVYLVCTWAYPGHETLSELMAAWTARLAAEQRGPYYVEDRSQEVFWNYHKEPHCTRIMLLNTDWSCPGNSKEVMVRTPECEFEVPVVEGQPLIVTILPDAALIVPPEMHLEMLSPSSIRVHGINAGTLTVYKNNKTCEIPIEPDDNCFNQIPQ